jgi:hypothetical protein
MIDFLKKHFVLITILFIVSLAISAWEFPAVAPAIGVALLVFSLGIAISSSLTKHKAAYHAGKLTRFAVIRNVFLDILGILPATILAALLGWYIAGLIGKQIDGVLLRFAVRMLVAIAIGIGVGILVRQVWGRFVKTSPGN